MTIAKLGRGIGGNKHRCLGLDGWQEAIAPGSARRARQGLAGLRTLPGDPIVAFAFGGELQLCGAFGVGLHRLRKYVVVLVAAKLQPPGFLSFSCRQWKCTTKLFLQEAKLFTFNLPAIWIEPDLPPVIARDFNDAGSGYRLLVRIEGFDVNGDFVFWSINVP